MHKKSKIKKDKEALTSVVNEIAQPRFAESAPQKRPLSSRRSNRAGEHSVENAWFEGHLCIWCIPFSWIYSWHQCWRRNKGLSFLRKCFRLDLWKNGPSRFLHDQLRQNGWPALHEYASFTVWAEARSANDWMRVHNFCSFAVGVVAAIRTQEGNITMEETVIVGLGRLAFFEDTEGNLACAMQYDQSAGWTSESIFEDTRPRPGKGSSTLTCRKNCLELVS